MKTKFKLLKKKPTVINGELIKRLGTQIREIVKCPEDFITAQPEKSKELLKILEQVYRVAFYCDEQNAKTTAFLPQLVIDGMQDEQIWQQLELRNNVLVPQLTEKVAKMMAVPEQQLEIRLNEDESESEEISDPEDEYNEGDEEDEELENDASEEEDNELSGDDDDHEDISEKLSAKQKKKVKPSVVDDKFFKLNEMEAFLEAEDAKEMRKKSGKPATGDYDGIDFFDENLGDEEDEDDEDDENPDYKDFFAEDENSEESPLHIKKSKDKVKKSKEKANKHQSKVQEESDEESDGKQEEDNNSNDSSNNIQPNQLAYDSASDSDDEQKNEEEKPKSSFELRQARLEQRIREYEEEVLGEKPWQLKGEIQASNRPQNSLLEEVLEFESTTRPAPIITEETTRRLEDIIKQRIRDRAWDDVVRKTKPIKTPQEFRKQLVLDQEKSKQSLAQVYEKEYQSAIDKLDPNQDEKEPEEPKENHEIRAAMNKLFAKLDALSNFHFTPKPVAPEPRIITNTPAINMEEVAPVAVSDANLLAPEEVFKPLKRPLMDKSERTKTDKNRERRKKKQKQRAIHKALEAKDQEKKKKSIPLTKKEEKAKLLKSVTKNRNVQTITANNDHGALKSSKAFFSKLQDTTTSVAMSKKAFKKKSNAPTTSAKKVKL